MDRLPTNRREVPTWWGTDAFRVFLEMYLENPESALLFVGSGLSRLANLPSWHELLTNLANRFVDTLRGKPLEIEEARAILTKNPSSVGYMRAGSVLKQCYNQHSAGAWREALASFLNAPHVQDSVSEVHNAFATLRRKLIITTNYDGLIERAHKGTNLFTIYPPNIHADVLREFPKPILLKLHGCICNPNSDIILTQEEYQDFYESDRYDTCRQVLERLLQGVGVTLFIGYSHSDEYVRMLFNKSMQIFRDTRLFALVPRRDDRREFPKEIATLSKQWQFSYIPFSRHNGYDELRDFISYLSLAEDERQTFDDACSRLLLVRRPTVIFLYCGGTISSKRRRTFDKEDSELVFEPKQSRFDGDLAETSARIKRGYSASLNSVDMLDVDLLWEVAPPEIQMFSENSNIALWNGIAADLQRVVAKYFGVPVQMVSANEIFSRDIYPLFERDRREHGFVTDSQFSDKDFFDTVMGRYILGIIILFGTDTMAYLASALALSLRQLPCPVIITGANRAPDDDELIRTDELRSGSDAWSNYWTSLYFLQAFGHRYTEVFVCFGETIHHGLNLRKRATRIIPISSDKGEEPEPFTFRNLSLYGQYMFRSIDGLFVNNYYSMVMPDYRALLRDARYRHVRRSISGGHEALQWSRFSEAIALFDISPGFRLGDLKRTVDGLKTSDIRAVLIGGYVSGTHPTLASHEFSEFLGLLDDSGIPAFLVSMYGIRPLQERYEELEIEGKKRPITRLFGIIAETALPLLSLVVYSDVIKDQEWNPKGVSGSDLTGSRRELVQRKLEEFVDQRNIIRVELQHLTDKMKMYNRLTTLRARFRALLKEEEISLEIAHRDRAYSDQFSELLLDESLASYDGAGSGPDGLLALTSLGYRVGSSEIKKLILGCSPPKGGKDFFDQRPSEQSRLLECVRRVLRLFVDAKRTDIKRADSGERADSKKLYMAEIKFVSLPHIDFGKRQFETKLAIRRGEITPRERKYCAASYSEGEVKFFEALLGGVSEDVLRTIFEELANNSWQEPQMGKAIDWFSYGYLKGGISECLRYMNFGRLVERIRTEGSAGLLTAFRRALRCNPRRIDAVSFELQFKYRT